MKPVVISLGGSVIVPDRIHVRFLKEFAQLLKRLPGKFIITTGGGRPAREFMAVAKQFAKERKLIDAVGIAATRLNANLVAATLPGAVINPDPTARVPFRKFLISHGWLPGSSSDYDAVLLAKTYGSPTIINVTNVPHVYDKDPRKFKDAKPFTELSWKKALQVMPPWEPGAHAPFDPVAGKLASRFGKEVIVLKGIANLARCLQGKPFEGTRIR
jgi:uridylate kinase